MNFREIPENVVMDLQRYKNNNEALIVATTTNHSVLSNVLLHFSISCMKAFG